MAKQSKCSGVEGAVNMISESESEEDGLEAEAERERQIEKRQGIARKRKKQTNKQ